MPKNILFFEKTPFMSVELLDLLKENYTIISYFEDGNFTNLKELGFPIKTFGNHNLITAIDSDIAVSEMLKDTEFISKITNGLSENSLALFFYMNEEMDTNLKSTKMGMALPPYNIQEKIGNKIFLNDICNKLGIRVNKSILIDKSNETTSSIFERLSSELFTPFIVQGSLGVSGEDTFIVNSEQDFMNCFTKLSDKFKASEFIKNNIPLSVHVCITKNKIYYEGPYIQLVGFKELADNPFQFSGNDTNQNLIPEKIKGIIFELSMKLSEYAKSEGYMGILGIDFLWDNENKRVYVQEINSRLVGLTRLLTGIQKEQRITPHLIRHINEFDQLKNSQDFVDKDIDLNKHDYSQIYISHNDNNKLVVNKYLLPGIYKINQGKVIRTKNSLFVSDMDPDEILVNFSIYEGTKLHKDQIMFKIILKNSVLNNDRYELNENSIKMIELLKTEIL